MTKEGYEIKFKGIEDAFKRDKNNLQKEYAFANAKYKQGDLITDHSGTIIVESIKYDSGSFGEYPGAVYYGTEYTKKGIPKKSGEKRNVWQKNIKF